MSRHRNIRSMNADDYRYDFDDVYGTSSDSCDYGASPGTMAQYTYDRSRHSQQYFSSPSHEEPIEEEDNFGGGDDDDGRKMMSDLSLSERAMLDSCLDEMRSIIDESVNESILVRAAISADFDANRAINYVMDSASKGNRKKNLTEFEKPQETISVIQKQKQPTPTAASNALAVPTLQTPRAGQPKGKPPPSKPEPKSHKYDSKPLRHELSEFGVESEEIPKPNPAIQIPAAEAPVLTKSASKAKMNRLDPAKEYETRMKSGKDYLNLVVVGHVDAGKSTLMGHVLYRLGFVSKRVMHKYEQEAKKLGKGSFAYAWVLDETEEERSRGVTMDVAQTTFETKTKVITLNDAPGHKDFIPNMITGAAQADVAILVINSVKGEFETGFETGGQTREHAVLLRSLGVSQLLVAVSKMDKVDWSKERFDEITKKLSNFFRQTGFKESDVSFVPCSGLAGDNLTLRSSEERFCWYAGPTLVEQIDMFKPAIRPALDRHFRMSVTDVFKNLNAGSALGGIVHAGNVEAGDKVLVTPANEVVSVKSVSIDGTKINMAFAGDSVVLTVSDLDTSTMSIGSILSDPNFPVQQTKLFRARIIVLNVDVPVLKGLQVVLHYQSLTEQAHLSQLVCQLHKNTGEVVKKKPRWLDKNSSAIVDIKVERPVSLELYSECKDLGRFMLRHEGVTVAAGLVTEIFKDKSKSKNGKSAKLD